MSRSIVLLALVFALPLSCAGTAMQTQARLGDEFATSEPTSFTRSGWRGDVYPQQLAVERMRLAASQDDATLLAAVFIRAGVHPYVAIAFLLKEDQVRVVQTHMYWGSVRSKAVSSMAASEAELLLAQAERKLACRLDAPLQEVEGAALIVWPSSGGQRLCSADWFSSQAVTLAELMSPVLASAETTYTSHDD